jgi:hypothetical protein
MPVAITTDYSGRTVDLESLQTADGTVGVRELSLSVRDNNLSRRITGIQKLAQRYATLFLTQKGSVGFSAGQGSDFIEPATTGQIANGANLTHFFNIANFQTTRQMRLDDVDPAFGDTPPDDERIQTATLIDFEVDKFQGRIYLKVRLTSLAGDDYVYVLPAI